MVLLAVLAVMVALLPARSVTTAQDAAAINCGTEEEATVTFASGSVGQDLTIMQPLFDAYMEACPNVTINVFALPESATDIVAFYLQLLEGQSSEVDVLQIDVIWPGILAEHLVDLGPYLGEAAADYFPRIVENNTVDGALVGIPWFTDAGLLYFRTDLLEKYGLEVPATWDELTVAAQTIQDGERAEGNAEFWGFVWQGNAYEGLTCDAIEWQASNGGGTIVSPEGEIQVNNDATIAALERAAGWVGTISPDGVVGYGEEDARGTFEQGNAAFMRNWPYAYTLGNDDESPIKGLFDVGPLPAGESGSPAAALGGWQLAVSKYSENVDASAALAVYLTSFDVQKLRAIEGSYLPTIMSLYEDPDVLEAVPFFGNLLDVFVNATPRPSTVTAEKYNQVSTLYFTAVHSVLTGEQDAATAMELLELDLEELLAE